MSTVLDRLSRGHQRDLRRTFYRNSMRLIPIVCLAAIPVWGQQSAPQQTPPAAPSVQPQGTANRAAAASVPNPSTKSKGRLFWVLPNYLTLENADNVPPLTPGGKFKLTAQNAFDPMEIAWYGALAGISQWENTDAVYGQGAAGYAKRYAVRFADGTIEDFFTRAIYPSIFHQDPRYYQLGKGSILHRTGYALSRVFVTRSDSGTNQFNISEILGGATASGIAAFSYHHSPRNVSNALDVWGSQVAWDALGLVMKEFWPDVRRKIHLGGANHVQLGPAGSTSVAASQ